MLVNRQIAKSPAILKPLAIRELSDKAGGGWCVDCGRKWYVIRANGRVFTRIASAAGIDRRAATKDERCAALNALRLSHFFVAPKKAQQFRELTEGMAGAKGLRKPRQINDLTNVRQNKKPNKPAENR